MWQSLPLTRQRETAVGSFVAGLAVIGLLFYCAFLYGSVPMGLIGFAVAGLWLAAALELFFACRHITAEITAPLSVADKGKKVAVSLRVSNGMPYPRMKVQYAVRIENTFLQTHHRQWVKGGPLRRGAQVLTQRTVLEEVGNVAFTLIKIRIYDVTGLFFRDKSVNSTAMVQVLPKLTGVAVRILEPVRRYYGEADTYDDFRPGPDSSQMFAVRAYQPGDRLQRVHWKLSAKTDTLFVREDSQPLACAIVLLLDYAPMAKAGAEVFLTVAADLVYAFWDAACPHYVAWYSKSRQEVVRIRVDDEESMYLFLTAFLVDAGTAAVSLPELYDAHYRQENPLHRLLLTRELELVMDGQKQMDFSGNTWKQKLTEMELVV